MTASWLQKAPALTFGRDVMTRTFALMWALGGTLVAAEVLFMGRVVASAGALWALTAGAFAIGFAAWRFRHSIPLWSLCVGAFVGVAVVTAAVVVVGEPEFGSDLVLLYLWTTIFAFVFFPPVVAWPLALFTVMCHSLVVVRLGSLSAASPLVLAATVGIVGLVIRGVHRGRTASETDPTTGSANAVGLSRFLQREIPVASRPLAVVVIDVAGTSGRSSEPLPGPVLADLAARWQRLLGERELLGWLATGHFVAVLSVASAEAAVDRVDQLRAAAGGRSPCWAGVAMHRPGDDAATLVGRAQSALAATKRSGDEHRVVVDGRDAPAAQELARAVDCHEFDLDWQPTVDLRTGALTGFETLVRWDHPTRGRLDPATFIPLAERTGLIERLGRWVLEEACRHAGGWEREFGLADLTVAVNVSGGQLESDEFIEFVRAALKRHGLPARRLTLEITESTVAKDLHAWRSRLSALRALGVQLAMDDFGTGYSSLSQLRDLPFSSLKIDRSFIHELVTDRAAEAMVAAVIRMAAELGREVVVEGVETPQQLAALRDHGCDRGQGYFLGRPAPADAARLLVSQHARGERPWLPAVGEVCADDHDGDRRR